MDSEHIEAQMTLTHRQIKETLQQSTISGNATSTVYTFKMPGISIIKVDGKWYWEVTIPECSSPVKPLKHITQLHHLIDMSAAHRDMDGPWFIDNQGHVRHVSALNPWRYRIEETYDDITMIWLGYENRDGKFKHQDVFQLNRKSPIAVILLDSE